MDFGIRGLDLTYALLDGYETVVIVDAVPRGDEPGTLHVLELSPPETGVAATSDLAIEGHNLDPVRVLRLAAALGSKVRRLFVVGCEPAVCGSVEEMKDGLSASGSGRGRRGRVYDYGVGQSVACAMRGRTRGRQKGGCAMSMLTVSEQDRMYRQGSGLSEGYEQYGVPARLPTSNGVSTGWLLAGLGAIALGAFAAYYFGPDFRRYVKMSQM